MTEAKSANESEAEVKWQRSNRRYRMYKITFQPNIRAVAVKCFSYHHSPVGLRNKNKACDDKHVNYSGYMYSMCKKRRQCDLSFYAYFFTCSDNWSNPKVPHENDGKTRLPFWKYCERKYGMIFNTAVRGNKANRYSNKKLCFSVPVKTCHQDHYLGHVKCSDWQIFTEISQSTSVSGQANLVLVISEVV